MNVELPTMKSTYINDLKTTLKLIQLNLVFKSKLEFSARENPNIPNFIVTFILTYIYDIWWEFFQLSIKRQDAKRKIFA